MPRTDVQPAILLKFPEIEHMVADRNADRVAREPCAENTP